MSFMMGALLVRLGNHYELKTHTLLFRLGSMIYIFHRLRKGHEIVHELLNSGSSCPLSLFSDVGKQLPWQCHWLAAHCSSSAQWQAVRSTLHHKQFGSLSQAKLLLEKTLQVLQGQFIYYSSVPSQQRYLGKMGMSMYDFAACENIIDILYYIDVVTSIKTKFDRS